MFVIPPLQSLGVTAVMTERCDGDCRSGTEGRLAALQACGFASSQMRCLKQVHGNAVAVAEPCDGDESPEIPAADALITAARGIVLCVSVADCIPVYFAVPGKAIGLAHSGRSGTQLNIAAATICALEEQYGVQPSAVCAYIGPGAGRCCYEVDTATAETWQMAGGLAAGRHLDLHTTIVGQLRAAGLAAERIFGLPTCTICTDRFFSYRRGDATQRNLALLAIR